MRKIIVVTLCVFSISACAVHGYRSDFEFAGKLAKEGLWQEAQFRLQKALAAGNNTAALHNNMAVALESQGRYEEARREYELALKLAPGNAQIQSNFSHFKKNQRKDENEK